MSKRLSRRRLLIGSASIIGVATIAGCSEPEEDDFPEEENDGF